MWQNYGSNQPDLPPYPQERLARLAAHSRPAACRRDAQPRIRGKCPLELAGYDTCAGAGVSQVPIASLCAGLSIAWPLEVA
ncbi:MAG: hypothetical protein ACE5F6_19290, partial [Anaerolineae bacterium]